MTTEPSQRLLDSTRHQAHPHCAVCSQAGPCALGLEFHALGDGSVGATFDCPSCFEGYSGFLHGGVISSLLDGAMTNCLFAHGIVAVTGEMTIRFGHPVELGTPLLVLARVNRSQPPLHVVEAEVTQEGQVKAKAIGKFMETPGGPGA